MILFEVSLGSDSLPRSVNIKMNGRVERSSLQPKHVLWYGDIRVSTVGLTGSYTLRVKFK